MDRPFPIIDIAVLLTYLSGIVGVGLYFARRNRTAEQYTTAERSFPGWAVGMSMFGSYISSISFLANPGKAFSDNWCAAGFTLATPIGLIIATRWFCGFYRATGTVSAYDHLEKRFGGWARTYAVVCYLLLQMGRMGMITFLLAKAVVPLISAGSPPPWLLPAIIMAIGALMTLYTLAGGIQAVVWTGVVQSVVLIAGPLICIVVLIVGMPGGLPNLVRVANEHGKFGFGPFDGSLVYQTFWLVVINAIIEHMRNWGVDQSYVQRYISARSEAETRKSIWIAGLLYMPVGFFFFFIGSALFAFYHAQPNLLPAAIDAAKDPDAVFPYFITHQLPIGLSGLVIAGIFAASMDTNLNSMATLTLYDIYKRYVRPAAGDREALHVLHVGTLFWGVACIGFALLMTLKIGPTIDFGWKVGGLLGGGILGLFLLGLLTRAGSAAAAIGVITGVVIILWMTLSKMPIWPTALSRWVSPFHDLTIPVVGTVAVVLVGGLASMITRGDKRLHTDPPAGL
ncbi:MAG: sodium/solute symporter [Chthonomonadales bacterium]|nr:sodium/solute symporter [Chthonomonadales bacterium]